MDKVRYYKCNKCNGNFRSLGIFKGTTNYALCRCCRRNVKQEDYVEITYKKFLKEKGV